MARPKSKTNYFTKETEEWIVKYNNSTDELERQRIFHQHIHYPLWRLAEAIIHTYKFYHTDVEDIEHLIHEVVSMLVDGKLEKFDPSNGAKAYSYYGTIVKRWLINYDNINYKKTKTINSFDSIEGFYETTYEDREEQVFFLKKCVERFIQEADKQIPSLFTNPDEERVANAIITLFKNRTDIEIFKKKAIYIYIREMTDCNTSSITKVLSTLKQLYKEAVEKQLSLEV